MDVFEYVHALYERTVPILLNAAKAAGREFQSGMVKCHFLSQCGVILLCPPRVLLSAGIKQSLIGISTSSFKMFDILRNLEFFLLVFKLIQPRF